MPDNHLIDQETLQRIFAPMDRLMDDLRRADIPRTLATMDGKIDVIGSTQRTHGDEIGKLRDKVDKLSDGITTTREEVAKMPGQWRDDIAKSVSNHRLECTDASGAIDCAEERGRAEAERLAANLRKGSSIAPGASRGALLRFVQHYLLYIIIGIAAIGTWVATKFGGSQPEVQQAIEQGRQAEKRIDQIMQAVQRLSAVVGADPSPDVDADETHESP
jgi:hypothetical protein